MKDALLFICRHISRKRGEAIDKTKSVRYNVRNRKGETNMLNTNITNFRKNVYSMLEQTIKYNEPMNISTKVGNAVVLSEEDYRGMMETLYLVSVPRMREKLLEGKATPLSECLPESEVGW